MEKSRRAWATRENATGKRNKTDLEFGFVGLTVQLHFAAAASAAVGEKLSAGHSVKKPSVTPTQSPCGRVEGKVFINIKTSSREHDIRPAYWGSFPSQAKMD